MRYVAVGTTVAIERPELHHYLGVMDCPTAEIAQREAARLNESPVQAQQSLLWEAD